MALKRTTGFLAAALAATLTATTLAACSQSTTPQPGAGTGSQSDSGSNTTGSGAPGSGATGSNTTGFDEKKFSGQTIHVMLDEHPWTDGVQQHLKEFTAATGITVDLKTYSEDLYFDKVDQALRSNNPPDVYMTGLDFDAASQFSAGLMEPLTPYIDDATKTPTDYDIADFPKGTLQPAEFPSGDPSAKLYAIPVSTETYILFYNKDLVDKYLGGTVPQTMDDLIKAAATVTEKAGGEVYGSVMRGVRSADSIMDTMTGMVFNELPASIKPELPYGVWWDGDWSKPRLTDPAIVKGVADYAALVKSGPPNSLNIDWPDSTALFQQGKAAFYVDASVFGPSFEDTSKSTVAGHVGYATLPKASPDGTTGLWSWGLAMAKASPRHDAAWMFMQYFTNKKMTATLGALTGGAPRGSATSDPAYTGALNADYVAAVGKAMSTARPTAILNGNAEPALTDIVDAMIAISQGQAPDKAMADAQTKVQAQAGQLAAE